MREFGNFVLGRLSRETLGEFFLFCFCFFLRKLETAKPCPCTWESFGREKGRVSNFVGQVCERYSIEGIWGTVIGIRLSWTCSCTRVCVFSAPLPRVTESERTLARKSYEGSVFTLLGTVGTLQSEMAWALDNETVFDTGNYVLNALNYINKLNESLNSEAIRCLELKHQEELERLSLGKQEQEQPGCEISWDSLLCWPRTAPGALATLPCLEELNGIRYDSTRE